MTEILLFLVGIAVGTMNSIAGGGMLLGYPAMLAVGMSPLVASATSHIVVVPGQIGAILGYRKYLRNISRLYFVMIIPCIVGAIIGASLLTRTSSEKFEDMVPFLLFLAVGLFIVQPFLHFHFLGHLRSKSKRILPLIFMCLAIFPLAIYGGYFGIGFGFVMLSFLSFTRLHDIHKINALKNVATLCIGLTSAIILSRTGLIDWQEGIIMSVGCAIGGYGGAHLAQRFSSHAIRITVIAIGVISVCYIAVKQ